MMKKLFNYNKAFPLDCGDSLDNIDICYHVSSESSAGKKVIWICHALTANSNVEEWWAGLTGPGKLFDTDKYYVICANILGSCYGSTGPTSIASKTGKAYLLDFPKITIRDQVAAHELLRKQLNIQSIDLLIGASGGGFQAIEWSVSELDVIKNMCLIATSAVVSPWRTAFSHAQRMALYADQSFFAQKDKEGGKKGLACARAIGLLSYRSYEGFRLTQKEENPDFLFANKACSYQEYQGKKLADRFDAYSYYTLTNSLDSHNVGRGRGGAEKALAKVKAKTLCIAITSDMLFPVSELNFIAHHIPNSGIELINSDFGHDGFLLENKQITKAIIKHNIL
ncbi:MAG: homoserine O-acetyltransferase [Prevotellaceae bacterium]|jgi:homoserine O-acetyltransferase|nr:homoserine O-acetyltransferase [Prevotellaceae bacterium]